MHVASCMCFCVCENCSEHDLQINPGATQQQGFPRAGGTILLLHVTVEMKSHRQGSRIITHPLEKWAPAYSGAGKEPSGACSHKGSGILRVG